jgi:hypothetical protein
VTDLSYAPVPRIDSLSPGDAVLLIFPSGNAPATFIMHNGTGEERTATFSTRTPEGEIELFDAFRRNKKWCYGSAATPLRVLGRALPPPPYGAPKGAPVEQEFAAADLLNEARSSVLLDGETQSCNHQPRPHDPYRDDPECEICGAQLISDGPGYDGEQTYTVDDRPFTAPNPTCACGQPATVPTSTPNLSVCIECAARAESDPA